MSISTADAHDWYSLDAERGLEVRQLTDRTEPNQWEIRTAAGQTVILNDDQFDQLRTGNWLPVELT